MKRAEIREYVFKLLYCTEFHEDEDLQKQYRLYMENLEQLGEIKEIKEKEPVLQRCQLFFNAGCFSFHIHRMD